MGVSVAEMGCGSARWLFLLITLGLWDPFCPPSVQLPVCLTVGTPRCAWLFWATASSLAQGHVGHHQCSQEVQCPQTGEFSRGNKECLYLTNPQYVLPCAGHSGLFSYARVQLRVLLHHDITRPAGISVPGDGQG